MKGEKIGKFNILIGDITDDKILLGHDLIVNPTNPQMVAGTGVLGAIFQKAGVDKLENYTQNKFNINYFSDNYKKENIMKIGDVRITSGFDLNIDIMFVQGPKQWEIENSEKLLFNTYRKMLNMIEKCGYKNVILPSLGTGEYCFKHEIIGKKVVKLLEDYIKDRNINIDLVLYNESDIIYYK